MKNLRGLGEVRLKKKLDSFTLERSKNHLIGNFLRNGRLRVNQRLDMMKRGLSVLPEGRNERFWIQFQKQQTETYVYGISPVLHAQLTLLLEKFKHHLMILDKLLQNFLPPNFQHRNRLVRYQFFFIFFNQSLRVLVLTRIRQLHHF